MDFTISLPTARMGSSSLSLSQDVAMPAGRAERDVQPLTLVHYSSNLSVLGPANTSTPSLQTTGEFPIPYTDYSLVFGNLGSHLYPWDLETLLIAVSAAIDEELAAHGKIARLPSGEYSKTLAGLELWIQKMPWNTDSLAWAELAVIVHGLLLYIVDGRHDRETFFDAVNHVTGRQVAFGRIGKPTSSTETVEMA